MSNTELAFSLTMALVPAAYFLGVFIGSGGGRRNALARNDWPDSERS